MGPDYMPSSETTGYPVYEPIGYIDQAGRKRERATRALCCGEATTPSMAPALKSTHLDARPLTPQVTSDAFGVWSWAPHPYGGGC